MNYDDFMAVYDDVSSYMINGTDDYFWNERIRNFFYTDDWANEIKRLYEIEKEASILVDYYNEGHSVSEVSIQKLEKVLNK
jgi:hypothetical protein